MEGKSYSIIGYDQLKSAICDVLRAVADESIVGLPISEIYHRVQAKGLRIPYNYVKESVQRMVQSGELEERHNPARKGDYYHLPGTGIAQQLLFDAIETRDEIEREGRAESELWVEDEIEREKLTASVLHEIAAGHALEDNYARWVRDIAPSLAAEDPVALMREMVEWVVLDLNKLADNMRSTLAGPADETRKLARELNFRRLKAVRFFQRLFRLDGPTQSIPGILDIPTVPQMMNGGRVAVDIDRAVERLRERIIGNSVIEVLSLMKNRHRAAVGTDASVGDVRVRHERGSFIPPTPAVLFVAAGAMQVIGGEGVANYWDYDIDPRDLEQYEDLDAAERGLLVSPKLRREAISDFRHLRSAAMELRQYSEELRIISIQSRWHPIGNVPELSHPPEITLMIRDGRIFPLVHRLDDYDGASAPDDVLYGAVVRNEIKTFRQVFHNTAGHGRMAATYGGAVKAPEFSWLAMLTFWYLQTKHNGEDSASGFYRPPLNDQAVTHLLFWGLAESNPAILSNPRNMFTTFRVIRRFSDIALPGHPVVIGGGENSTDPPPRIVDESSEKDWHDFINHHIRDANQRYERHQRGVPALTPNEYRAFIDLCRRAGVVMFYGAPARMYHATINNQAHFLTPRWEFALDLTQDTSQIAAHHLESLESWLVEADGLEADQFHAVADHEEPVEGLPLWIPNVVMRAHEVVSHTQRRHRLDIEDRLQQLVHDIREGKITLVLS